MDYLNISDVVMNSSLPKIDFNVDDGEYELAVSLLDYCNMRCDFCFQSHNMKKFDFHKLKHDIDKLPEKIYNIMLPEIIEYNIHTINLKLWGGELFDQNYPPKIYKVYELFYSRLVNLFKYNSGIEVKALWLTNGCFINYEYAYKLIKKTHGQIAMSFDPVGRFKTQKQLNSWIESFMFFYNKPDIRKIVVSITPTKKNISEYPKCDIFKNIIHLRKVEIDISYYTASKNYLEDMPDDEDMYNFYKFLVDNKVYNCKVLADIMNVFINDAEHPMYCNCKKAMQVCNGIGTKNCARRTSFIPSKDFYGEYDDVVDEQNCAEYKNTLGILKRGCLYCKWYSVCQKTCWISIIFKEYKADNCPLKRIYEYIESKPELIDSWRVAYND